MNRNRKMKMKTGVAVSMALIMSSMPAAAAVPQTETGEKEETVYVTTDASGKQKEVIVSNKLINEGTGKTLEDYSELKDIINVKGEETFTEKNGKLVWNTEGEDIFYQGRTDKELPVSVKFTYLLDGKEINPSALPGKSGKLTIRISYENKEKRIVKLNGKEEELFAPFMMMTGLILPNDKFSNVEIDNGKILDDGSSHIVIGAAMPGWKESLDSDKIDFPETLEVTADVKDFSMNPAYTLVIPDALDLLDADGAKDLDDLQKAVSDLDDAAIELASGAGTLQEGTSTLYDKYQTFDEGTQKLKKGTGDLKTGASSLYGGISAYTAGTDALEDGIRTYLGEKGLYKVSIKEYKNGVLTLTDSISAFASGANTLAGGTKAYISGEKQLAEGAAALASLPDALVAVKTAISGLNASLDGEGTPEEDLKAATKALADGMAALNAAVNSQEMQNMSSAVDGMIAQGNALLTKAEGLSGTVGKLETDGETLKTQLGTVQETLKNLNLGAAMVAQVNGKIQEKNGELTTKAQEAAQTAQNKANENLAAARQSLEERIAAAEDPAVAEALQAAKENLSDVTVEAAQITPIEEIPAEQGNITIPGMSELAASMEATSASMKETLTGLLEQDLPEMKNGLNALGETKQSLPSSPFESLRQSVGSLNTGTQKLNQGMSLLSANVSAMDEQTALLPAAGEGINTLLAGFALLGENNESLMTGADSLSTGADALLGGLETIKEASTAVETGTDTLSSTLTEGIAQLTGNNSSLLQGAGALTEGMDLLSGSGTQLTEGSKQVLEGIAALKDGVDKLKDGADRIEKEGTGKLKTTVDEDVVALLDRLHEMGADSCAYTTFSGKSDNLGSSVRFMIQTEGIGEAE